MNDENPVLPIRSALIPVFYQKFHCLAQDCRDNCCAGNWSITFDKKDYLRLRHLDAPAELRERLAQGVRRERKNQHDGVMYGKFDLDANGGRCPFWGADGLCSIQQSCGSDALPEVCRTYPRGSTYSPAAKEYRLSPSCEGVLQQLWDLPDGVDFVEEPLPEMEWQNAVIDLDESLQLYFAPLRALFIDILQNRDLSLTERMLYLGVTIQRLQQEDWAAFDPYGWCGQALSMANTDAVREWIAGITGNRDMYLTQNMKVLSTLTTTDRSWVTIIYDALETNRKQQITMRFQPDGSVRKDFKSTIHYSKEAYMSALERFERAFGGCEYFFENLMVASALYLGFPKLDSKESLWKSYVSMCSLYSFFRFASVMSCKEAATKENLFHYIVMASRATLHNGTRFDGIREDLFQHDSTTLAHMAILLIG